MKICEYCNKEFIPESKKAIYCSTSCRQKAFMKRKDDAVKTEKERIVTILKKAIAEIEEAA